VIDEQFQYVSQGPVHLHLCKRNRIFLQLSSTLFQKEIDVYCSKCGCDFTGWTGKCPVDGTRLVEKPPIDDSAIRASVPYETIVDFITGNEGKLKIDLRTTEVGKGKKLAFPGRGYGFAWARRMQGSIDVVDLHITEVGIDKTWGFPYQGYGFAWERQIRGYIGGNEIVLAATKVAREKKFSFPYRGHGYSWTEEFTGDCGELIRADMQTTDVTKEKSWFLFYFMFGYAWINRATLKLSLTD